ncbi:MAG: DUF305 domain-containing protein [Actinomycetota bacterium]|nr:DUF305 domain-containing protein [Actinomycetota bacterium]
MLILAAAVALAGCGSKTNGVSGGSGDFNAADVTFAQSMIPHHQQAVQMARMAKMHASSTELKQLAGKIDATQGPEIKTMTSWLEHWGKGTGSMNGMNHMLGMVSNTDMKGLGAATGAAFDRMFLTMMVRHHMGAIEMARAEQSRGKSPDAVALAKKIEGAQTVEVAKMRKMLKP